jgi:hypothetical protein
MRTNSFAGIIFLYVFIAIIASIAEERNVMTVVAGAGSVTHVGSLWVLLHPMEQPLEWPSALFNCSTLWFNGTLWSGNWIWAYYLIAFPVVVGTIVEVLSMFGSILSSIANVLGGAFSAVAGIFTGR